jgi:hypothetical protein
MPVPQSDGSHRLLQRMRDDEACERILKVVSEALLGDPTLESPLPQGWKPVDPASLRGIPAVGGDAGGAIRGTRPDRDAPSLRNPRRGDDS